MRIPALRGAYGTAEETQVSASIPIRCRKLQLGFLHLVLGQIVSISCIALQRAYFAVPSRVFGPAAMTDDAAPTLRSRAPPRAPTPGALPARRRAASCASSNQSNRSCSLFLRDYCHVQSTIVTPRSSPSKISGSRMAVALAASAAAESASASPPSGAHETVATSLRSCAA